MQRINLFPNPNFAGPLTGNYRWGGANGAVRDNALHVTGSSGGYGVGVTVPINVPLVLSVRADASEDNVASISVWQANDNDSSKNQLLFSQKIKQGTSNVLARFMLTDYRLRIEVNPNRGHAALSQVLIERADTYDPAVGGGFRASSRATRCRAHRSVRRAGDVR